MHHWQVAGNNADETFGIEHGAKLLDCGMADMRCDVDEDDAKCRVGQHGGQARADRSRCAVPGKPEKGAVRIPVDARGDHDPAWSPEARVRPGKDRVTRLVPHRAEGAGAQQITEVSPPL